MRRLLVFCVFVLACASARAQTVSDDEKKDGFVPLFNGKDFTGFRFTGKNAAEPKNWSVADGMIKLSGGSSPHLATQWDYDDFEVRIEWRPQKKGYNSGFYIRSGRDVGANQINLAQKDAGHLMGGAKGGPAVPQLQKQPGEWNDWRVRAVGDKLTFHCNGELAWEVTGFKPARGYLGLQAEGAAIDFRNLRVKELGYAPVTLPLAVKVPAYTLRLEYLTPADSKVELALGAAKLALGGHKSESPAGQWNYLEVAVKQGKAAARLNGTPIPIAGDAAGAVTLAPAGAAPEVRNARVRGD